MVDDSPRISPPDHRNPRETLPPRRTAGQADFRWGGIDAVFTAGFSCYPASWRPAEIFLTVSKTQGSLEKECRDSGILASLALQHGATLDALIAGVTHETDGTASSIIGTALTTVRDAIARERGGDGTPEPVGPTSAPTKDGGDGGAAMKGAAFDTRVNTLLDAIEDIESFFDNVDQRDINLAAMRQAFGKAVQWCDDLRALIEVAERDGVQPGEVDADG